MAQSGYTPISLYFSATGAAVPTAANLVAGELALNTNDGKLYFKNSAGVVTLLAGSTSGPAGGSNTQVQYNNSGVLAGITGATTNGTALTLVAPNLGSPSSVGTMPAFTLGGTVSGGGNQINNVVIGTATPLAGAFTTLSATGNITSVVGGNLSVSDGTLTTNQSLVANANVISLYNNFYYNAGFKYITSNFASNIELDKDNGIITASLYASGTANNALPAASAKWVLSTTGLAVTGTLSATTTGQVGTTLGVGNATPSASGAGITFPATQSASTDANTLDDYEEGTWTPTCNAGATLTLSGSPQYVKIGKQVTIHAEFSVSVNASGTQFQISGLPFASNSSTGNSTGVVMGYFATDLAAYLPSNASTITFQNIAASANKTNIELSGKYLIIACTYFSAT